MCCYILHLNLFKCLHDTGLILESWKAFLYPNPETLFAKLQQLHQTINSLCLIKYKEVKNRNEVRLATTAVSNSYSYPCPVISCKSALLIGRVFGARVAYWPEFENLGQ